MKAAFLFIFLLGVAVALEKPLDCHIARAQYLMHACVKVGGRCGHDGYGVRGKDDGAFNATLQRDLTLHGNSPCPEWNRSDSALNCERPDAKLSTQLIKNLHNLQEFLVLSRPNYVASILLRASDLHNFNVVPLKAASRLLRVAFSNFNKVFGEGLTMCIVLEELKKLKPS